MLHFTIRSMSYRQKNMFLSCNARDLREHALDIGRLREFHRIAPDEWRAYVNCVFVGRFRKTISWKNICLDCINNSVADLDANVSE
jgi:hypothetical protein